MTLNSIFLRQLYMFMTIIHPMTLPGLLQNMGLLSGLSLAKEKGMLLGRCYVTSMQIVM